MERYLLRALLAVSALFSLSVSQTYDVLVIEKTGLLNCYDEFQKSIPPDLLNRILPPFVPIKIVKNQETLGDGVTPCMKAEVDGSTLYLLTDEKYLLSFRKREGTVLTYRDKSFIGDTIEILKSGYWSLVDPLKRTRKTLPAGEKFMRAFSDGGMTYVKWLADSVEFGWLSLPGALKGKTWRVVVAGIDTTGLSPAMVDRLLIRIQQANRALAEIYALLSQESGRLMTTPQWVVSFRKRTITCTLEPSEAALSYKESLSALSAALQTYFLGSGYEAIVVGNKIEIRKP